MAAQVATQLQAERDHLIAKEAGKAKLASAAELVGEGLEVTDLQEVLKARDEKLAEAQKAQGALIKTQRELDDARRELELTIEKRVQDSLAEVREKAKRETEEGLKLKVLEKDQTIASMQRAIEELKRKAEQGSQQLQGEVQELESESVLRVKFPFDSIEPVPKGEFGGDVLQRVVSANGQAGGTILWECKRTRNWERWLARQAPRRPADGEGRNLRTRERGVTQGCGDLRLGRWCVGDESPRRAASGRHPAPYPA